MEKKGKQVQQYWHKTTLKTQSTASNNIKSGCKLEKEEESKLDEGVDITHTPCGAAAATLK